LLINREAPREFEIIQNVSKNRTEKTQTLWKATQNHQRHDVEIENYHAYQDGFVQSYTLSKAERGRDE